MTTTAIRPETSIDAQPAVTSFDVYIPSSLPSESQPSDGPDQENHPEKPSCEMKFHLKQEDCLRVLTLVMKAAGLSSTSSVLAHVLVATRPSVLADEPAHVLFTCSNQETTISDEECEAHVEVEGTWTIPVKPLLECIKTFPKGKHFTIEVRASRVYVTCGTRVFKLKGGMDADEFPLWPKMLVDDGAPCSLEADVLRQAIKEVQFAASVDDARPVLTTICVKIQEEQLILEAVDGYRMAVRTITLPIPIHTRDATFLAPVASLRLLADVMPSACHVVLFWDKARSYAVFHAGLVQVAVRLSVGQFPNVKEILPQAYTASFTLPRSNLDQIVRAFKPFAQDNANIFTLSYRANGEQGIVSCLAESEELGEASDEISVPVEGKDGQIIFNIRFLMDILKNVPVDAFTFKLTTGSGPGLLLVDGRNDYFYILMPMSRNQE